MPVLGVLRSSGIALGFALLAAASGCHHSHGHADQGNLGDGGSGDAGKTDGGAGDGMNVGDGLNVGDGMNVGDGGLVGDGMNVGDGGLGDAGPTAGLVDVDPGAASRQVPTDVTVNGFGIQTGAGLSLVPCLAGQTVDGGVGTIMVGTLNVAMGGASATFNLPADPSRAQGLYSVVLSNPDGSGASLSCAFTVTALAPPTVTNVQPATAYRGVPNDGVLSDQPVTITGTGFEPTPRVVLRARITTSGGTVLGPPVDTYQVSWVSPTTLTAVVPSETDSMTLGDYTVEVINPNLLEGTWANPFKVVNKAPPKINSITPLSSSTRPQAVTLCGTGFDASTVAPAPTAYVVVPPGTTCAALLNSTVPTASVDPVSGYTRCAVDVSGTAGACLGTGQTGVAVTIGSYTDGAYPIEWVNGDGQSSIYYNFSYITSAQPGHLKGCWEAGYDATGALVCDTSTPTTPFPALAAGRWRHGMTYDFDEFGNTYLFVVGGQTSRTAAPLASVETTQIDVFGRPGPWRSSLQFNPATSTHVANPLSTGRTGLSVVHLGAHLYAVGGSRVSTADNNAVVADTAGTPGILKTTEHAVVLGYDTRPNIQKPVVAAVPPGQQGLPKGTWYYRVAGYEPVSGESLASRETAVQGGGKITVKWLPATTTTASTTYNVYRSLASDGRANSEILIATGVTGTSYSDDGVGANLFAPGHLSSTATTGGTFAATPGTQPLTYVVSSVVGGLERVGYATQIVLDGSTQTAVSLSWDSVPGATYNVYRYNYGSQQYELLTGTLATSTTSYTDTGSATTAGSRPPLGEAPLPAGSLSKWALLADPTNAAQPLNMAYAREGLEATTIALSDGMSAVIYAAGGRSAVAGADYLHSVETLLIPLSTGLPAVGWKLQGDGVGATVVGHPFTNSRAFYALTNSQDHDVIPHAPPPKEPPCTDFDGDGFKPCSCFAQTATLDATSCGSSGAINATNSCDCNDNDPSVYPCALDVCGDGIAQNCIADKMCPMSCSLSDADKDGYSAILCGGNDCCDVGSEASLGCSTATAQGIHPGATEICGNGIDENCDGIDPACTTACTTDADGDGYISCACYPSGAPGTACGAPNCDCNDSNKAIHPCAPDILCNGIAENCVADICILSVNVAGHFGPTAGQSTTPLRETLAGNVLMSVATLSNGASPATSAQANMCSAPAWLVADQGQSAFNVGQASVEACAVDTATGDLGRCDALGTVNLPFAVQTAAATGPKGNFGLGAQLWDIGGVPTIASWPAATNETLTAGPSISSSSGNFWNVDLTEDSTCHFAPPTLTGCTGYGCAVYGNQSADSKFLPRAYYRTARVAGYVFVVGGWLNSLNAVSGDLERHLQ